MRKFLLFLTLTLIVVTSVQLWMTKDRTDQTQDMDIGQGSAQIGGNFTLTDQNGNTVNESDFKGRIMLVFFGFTSCPDICPVTVANFSKTMELLGSKADQVAPVFITVDPERDTPQVMKDYLANFDKHIVGLTGTVDQIKETAEAYKAYFAKHDIPYGEEEADKDGQNESATDIDDEATEDQHEHHAAQNNYAVDHSGYIYMMGMDGKYVRIFPYNASPEELTRAIEHTLNPAP